MGPNLTGPRSRVSLVPGTQACVCIQSCTYMFEHTQPHSERPTMMHKWTHNLDTYPQGWHTCIQPHMYNIDFSLHIHIHRCTHTTKNPCAYPCRPPDTCAYNRYALAHSPARRAHTYNRYLLAQSRRHRYTLLNVQTCSDNFTYPRDAQSQSWYIPTPINAQMHTLADIHLTHIHRTTSIHRHKADTHSNKHTDTKRSTFCIHTPRC